MDKRLYNNIAPHSGLSMKSPLESIGKIKGLFCEMRKYSIAP